MAENLFEEDFKTNLTLPKGELKDCRDNGCGYDYEILSQDGSIFYIEVKGLASNGGGILFTSKEWNVALEKLDKYYLCIVKNVNDTLNSTFAFDFLMACIGVVIVLLLMII